jgi:hypothetical protein
LSVTPSNSLLNTVSFNFEHLLQLFPWIPSTGGQHRFWAEDKPFRMLVVSFGRWKAEDQYRYEDDYGRKGKELSL